MIVAIYARQSIEKDKSLSIEQQIHDCRAYIERTEKSPDIVIYKDRGYSGKNTERPELQKLIQEIERNRIDKVVCYKLDRISRNILDFYIFNNLLEAHSCALSSLSESFDTQTPTGRLLMNLLANFAQLERENIQERVKASYYMRARTEGRWLGGRTPYGFKLSKTSDGISTLEPTKEAEIVKDLFKKYAYDPACSLHQLIAFLNKKYKIIKTATAVNNILSNPIYTTADYKLYSYYKNKGVNFLNPIEDWQRADGRACQIINKTDQTEKKTKQNPPQDWSIYLTNWRGFIDSTTFLMCQERLSQNVKVTTNNTPSGRFQELSGLVKCAKCGRAVKIKAREYMSCVGRSELRGVCDASFKGIRLQTIREQLEPQIQNYLDNIKEQNKKYLKKNRELRKQAEKLEQEIKNLTNILAEAPAVSKAIIEGIEEREKALAEINSRRFFNVSPADYIETRVAQAMNTTPAPVVKIDKIDYKKLTTEQKQALLKIAINRIYLDESGAISIDWKE